MSTRKAIRTSSSTRATSLKVAAALARAWRRSTRERAVLRRTRYQAFATRWSEAQRKWVQQAAAARGRGVIAHHKNMSYLWNWLGMRAKSLARAQAGHRAQRRRI